MNNFNLWKIRELNIKFTAIAIDTTLLSLTQPPHYSPHLCSLINISTPATDFIGSLRQVIKSLSTKKYPTISEVAQITGISSRTLQRQLREAEVNYTEVINQIQFERAKIILKDTDMKLREISEQLGYSTQGHFSRAFKRWTGITPQLFRHFSSGK